MNFLSSHPGWIVSAIGGIGVIMAWVFKGSDAVVDWAIDKALSEPDLEPIIMKYRQQIEDLFDHIDARVKADLEAKAASQKLSNPPK